METREITKQAKQNLTIFKKQLHECQCKENRLKEYYEKKWLTEDEFKKKMRKLKEKEYGFAKKYLTKYNELKNLGKEVSPEQGFYAMKAAITISSWNIVNSPSALKIMLFAGVASAALMKEYNKLGSGSEIIRKKKEREI